jgi:hypothetical protein
MERSNKMNNVEYIPEEDTVFLSDEEMDLVKARARKEAAKTIPQMKVLIKGTEEGAYFEEAYSFLKGFTDIEDTMWVSMIMYQYGLEQGAKRKKANPEG